MVTNFIVLSSFTVNKNYSWDFGVPNNFNTLPGFTTSGYISGYAPHVKVWFSNNSIVDPPLPNTTTFFRWDFGDYYNDDTNSVSVSCTDHCIDHVYVMPGIYTVTLSQIKIKKTFIATAGSSACIGKYNKLWYWDNLICNAPDITNRITWDDTSCALNGPYKKTWDVETECLQKHCKNWNWKELKASGGNPIRWNQTPLNQVFEKKWQYEPPASDCSVGDFDFEIVTDVTEEKEIKTFLIEVKELPPTALLCLLTTPSHGVSPFTVRITPRFCKPGSFPFERIVWDFGDGTPLRTVSRYGIPDSQYFTFTNNYPNDPADPRNYDASHVYTRTAYNSSTFYPSITAYCSNTNSYDACSVTIGPLDPEPINVDPAGAPVKVPGIRLLKTRNVLNNNFYTVKLRNQLGFLRSFNLLTLESPSNILTTPVNPIRNACNVVWPYLGNTGLGYPPTAPTILCGCINGPPLPPTPPPPTLNALIITKTCRPGSVIVTYTAQTMFPVDAPVTVTFTSVISGTIGATLTSIDIDRAITIPAGYTTTGQTVSVTEFDYTNLSRNCTFTNLNVITPPFTTIYTYPVSFNCVYIDPTPTPTPTPTIPPTPTPTPTPTHTPTPTPTPIDPPFWSNWSTTPTWSVLQPVPGQAVNTAIVDNDFYIYPKPDLQVFHSNFGYNGGNINATGCTSLQDLQCDSQNLTGLKVENLPSLNTLVCSYNSLIAFEITNSTNLIVIAADNNLLSTDTVNHILTALDSYGQNNGLLLLDGGTNASPTGEGITAKDNLVNNKGWTIVTN